MEFLCSKTDANPPTCGLHKCILVPRTLRYDNSVQPVTCLYCPQGKMIVKD
jgi:hypothetical protein